MSFFIRLSGSVFLLLLGWACGGGSELAGTRVQGTGGGTGGNDTQLTKTVLVQGPLKSNTGLDVGGISFGTTANTQVTFNGNLSTTAELRAGMWLEVTGTYDSNTLEGLAETVTYEILLTGEIQAIAPSVLTVDGLSIRIDDDTFLDEGLSEDEFFVGQDLVISGTTDGSNNVYASYMALNDENLEIGYIDEDPDYEFEDDFEVLSIEGPIESLQGTTGMVVDERLILIDDDTETFSSQALAEDLDVVVYAEWVSGTTWLALEIHVEEELDGFISGNIEAVDPDEETLTINGEDYRWDEFSYFIDFSEGDEYEEEWEEIQVGDEVFVEYAEVDGVKEILWAERWFTSGEVELEGFFIEEGGDRYFISYETYRSYTFSNYVITNDDLLLDDDVIRGIVRPDLFGDDFEAEVWVIERTDL